MRMPFPSLKLLLRIALATPLLLPPAANAQRTASVAGTYTYVLSENDNITIKEAKLRAIDMARAEAIKDEFGTLVVSDYINTEKGIADDTQSFFVLDTSSSAKGEWLGDEKNPEVTIECIDNEIFFTAKVWGKAREIVRAKTQIDWKVLKKEGNTPIETERFKSGERIYLNFRAPSDGYAAVYLITGDDQTSCLLPYRNDTQGRVPVRGGREYTFFDKTTDPGATHYKLSTSQPQEFNQVVVIYSPNPFTKCLDTGTDPRRPNTLEQKAFAKWLLTNQRADKEMVVCRKWIAIEARED